MVSRKLESNMCLPSVMCIIFLLGNAAVEGFKCLSGFIICDIRTHLPTLSFERAQKTIALTSHLVLHLREKPLYP